MTPQEHLDASSELAARSDQEFDQDGNRLIAAELLWGAVAHNFIVAADFHPDWQIRGHSYYAFVATQLGSAEPDTQLASGHRSSWPSAPPLLQRRPVACRPGSLPRSREATGQRQRGPRHSANGGPSERPDLNSSIAQQAPSADAKPQATAPHRKVRGFFCCPSQSQPAQLHPQSGPRSKQRSRSRRQRTVASHQ